LEKTRTCKNKCIFCFISQLPENLRPTLYIKDDDYLESYTNGNFITLTNLSKKDLDRIIRFRIEPLHISIHSFNREIRNILFGNDKNFSAIEFFFKLDKNKVRTNIQIVVCPGINDGADLENTLKILSFDFKNVLSIGIVPVGITKYNTNPMLKAFSSKKSRQLIDFIDDFKQKYTKSSKINKIYLSDEFYLIAKKEFPKYEEYGRFLQIQNGIGKSVNFLRDFEKEVNKKHLNLTAVKPVGKNSTGSKRILIITSEYGKKVLKQAFHIFNELPGNELHTISSHINIIAVKNIFFGGNVKVTGLIAGKDIIEKINLLDLNKYERILIPDIIFNKFGFTIDDLKINDFLQVSSKIISVKDSGKKFYKALGIK
jgi:putative radical SAM enzyme (TIGR03279 family)